MGDRSFGRLIRKRRESLGLSQARLGELVGRSSSTIRNWERDKSTPAARSDAVALAAVLGLDEAEVLDRAGFEVDGERTHQTVEEAYASLTPSSTVREDQDVRPETDEELDRESAPGEAEEPAQPLAWQQPRQHPHRRRPGGDGDEGQRQPAAPG